MFDALKARLRRASTDDTKEMERQAKRAARAVARANAQEHHRQLSTKGEAEASQYQRPDSF
jgi:hypothetical protein